MDGDQWWKVDVRDIIAITSLLFGSFKLPRVSSSPGILLLGSCDARDIVPN